MKKIAALDKIGLMLVALAMLLPVRNWAQASPPNPAEVARAALAQDLGLTPEKAETFMDVGQKYEQGRQEILTRLRANEDELQQALAAPQPDGAKISRLVTAITTASDRLWESYQRQRQEEMALLTPVQQGKFLMALKKWHQALCARYEKQGQQ